MHFPTDEPLLQGLRVLDLSQGIAGPYCGDILQQQGAEVIKVEPPAGDWARHMGATRDGFSAVVLAYNVGKSGLCVDAGMEEGRRVLQKLASQVDVVIQNFRPGVVERLGLDYATLVPRNERLVYVSISGFGSDGPMVNAPATDSVMQAMSGMMYANRHTSGQPQKVGLYLADIAAAMYASQLVSAALYRRSITGKGRHLELSLLEACAALQASNIVDAAFSAGAPASAATAPSGIFAVSDGFITLSTLNNGMFSRLCDSLGASWLAKDERFLSNKMRLENAQAINEEVAGILQGQSLSFWLQRLQAADVLHAGVNNYESLLTHPQVRHAGIFTQLAMDGFPPLPRTRQPGCAAGDSEARAPRLGEHSAEVLACFGFVPEDIATLMAQKAVLPAQP
jgi:crotonobetainyl-CoA:carnitine CoA-transferase CaiB-like acyl-CoA transferase